MRASLDQKSIKKWIRKWDPSMGVKIFAQKYFRRSRSHVSWNISSKSGPQKSGQNRYLLAVGKKCRFSERARICTKWSDFGGSLRLKIAQKNAIFKSKMQFLGFLGEMRKCDFEKFESRCCAAILGCNSRTDVARKICLKSSVFSPDRIFYENVADFKSAYVYRNFCPVPGHVLTRFCGTENAQ